VDAITRVRSVRDNPAALLALGVALAGANGRGDKKHGGPAVSGPAHGAAALGYSRLVMEVGRPRPVDRTGRTVRQGADRVRLQGVSPTSTPTCNSYATGRTDFFVTFVRQPIVARCPIPPTPKPGTNLADHLFRRPCSVSAAALRGAWPPDDRASCCRTTVSGRWGALVGALRARVRCVRRVDRPSTRRNHQTGIDKYTALPGPGAAGGGPGRIWPRPVSR